MRITRQRIRLGGVVQGVGFRPFVHRLAVKHGLAGFVANSTAGVVTEVEGDRAAVDAFRVALVRDAPSLARVGETGVDEVAPRGDTRFEIRASMPAQGEYTLVSPDAATCPDCLRDLSEAGNRRRGYAFTNCTNCGPRYTIIRDVPYDRPGTTMAGFRMCAACQAEYDDPANRRFHAQPNACPQCGPSLSGDVAEARRRLAAGEVVAIKGLGGFQLACDARNADAVRRLRGGKRRSDKPFAVMVRDVAAARRLAAVSDKEAAVLEGWRRPIAILRSHEAWPEVAPANGTLGVMLPSTPLHYLLFENTPYDVLVMTSGNRSDEPLAIDNAEAARRLNGVADWQLTHNRDICMRADDSVVRCFQGSERLLRRARGYAPETLDLRRTVPEMLAVGGELKNAFCLTKGRHAILSQHIGDLENYETLVFFEETLAHLKRLFRVEPRLVAHDLHPGYLSTRYALAMEGVPKLGVQHHHAHVASCMAENGLDGEVIGVAFDGTGYGTDGAIWGGEFLVAGYREFTRRAHLRYVPLAGGDRAVRQPWRSAVAYGLEVPGVADERQHVVRQMIQKGLNTVPTSSCGRLFDAVAAIVGLRSEATYEGQAAIELEALADDSVDGRYEFTLSGEELDFGPTMESIARSREGRPAIAARFHNTLAAAIVETCRQVGRESGLRRVCLSGGTFQNVKLLAGTIPALRSAGFAVYLHAQVPPNDGGIALGQAAIAARRSELAAEPQTHR